MSESRSSLYKLLTWVLLAALIGVYGLYHWYTGGLRQNIAAQRAALAQAAQRQSAAEQQLQAAAVTEQTLKAQNDDLKTRLEAVQGEHQALVGQHETVTAQVERHRQEIAQAAAREQELNDQIRDLSVQYTQASKAVVNKLDAAHAAWVSLESEDQAAKARVKELEAEVTRLRQTGAAAEAKNTAQCTALESKVNERVRFYRSALEGSDPDRAALIAGLEQQVTELRATLEQTGQEAAAARTALADQLANAERNVEDLTARLAAAEGRAAEHAQTLTTTKASHEEAASELRGKVFALTEELQSERGTRAALEQTHAQGVAELAEVNRTLEEVRTQVSAAAQEKLALEEDLKTERTRAEQSLTALRKEFEEAQAAQLQAKDQALTHTRGLFERYAELHAQKTERGMLISLAEQELHFASGASTLPKGAIPSLDQIAALLQQYPQLTAIINGHTDSSGSESINLALSKARAEAVRQGLIERGVAPERLTAEGLGETRPVGDNATPTGRLKNRRVEVLVIEP
ncbi:OmpA family protein [uncultured Lamprocystis sp.]|jgi:outer membrane protein OmpA-like peptidoglycan-associated protein|uniref:OmpA family protein n=1 Tax=uncultured Lamprocystis sp. TaxID=543132 RepID=UPI0025EF6B25|nr:OmpA family protein [uncultured Lamprocystis sp.]